jgi:hypothetical protein
MEPMQVYHLTIQENGHSRRFVYEDRDEALARFADAIAAGLDAKLDEVVRAPTLPKPTEKMPDEIVPVRHHGELLGAVSIEKKPGESLTPTERKLVSDLGSQAGLVRRNVALIADLRASRQRLSRRSGRRTSQAGTHQGPAGKIGNRNRSSVPGPSTQALRTSPEKYTFSLTEAGRNARATTRCFFIEFSAENGWERVSLTRVPRSPWRMEFGGRRVSHASR